ncbi:MAG: hypothetical protein NEA02_17425, partial [Thermoanaerobaculia bacterium]|nr:hypothetical protein [Thermoanaerobaculia bacterium]
MKKSCALSAAVWLALVVAYGAVAWQKSRETVPTVAIGFLGGTFAALLVSSAWGLVTGGDDLSALRRALRGEPPM